MALVVKLKGIVTEAGELRVELPDDFPPGEVEVTVAAVAEEEIPWEERPWTEAEIKEMMTPRPVPASKIVTGGWEDLGITDSVAWVEEVRRQEQERRGW